MGARHVSHLFDGLTASEYHSKHAFPVGAKCSGCKTLRGLTTRIMVLFPLAEMKKIDPLFDLVADKKPEVLAKTLVQTVHGPHVRMSTVYACEQCCPAAEKAAAKGPSWAIVDIHRGPPKDRFMSGAAGGSNVD